MAQDATAFQGSPVTALAFAPNGEQLLTGSQSGIAVLNWPSLESLQAVSTELVNVHDLSFSPDGKWLLAAGGSPGESGIVEMIRWPDTSVRYRYEVGEDLVVSVAWAPAQKRWVAASATGVVAVFSPSDEDHTPAPTLAHAAHAAEPDLFFRGHSRGVLAALFLPDGDTVVSAGIDQSMQIWKSSTGEVLRGLTNHSATINSLALKPIVQAGPALAANLSEHAAHGSAATNVTGASDKALRKAPDLKTIPLLASASDDRTVRLWQPTIGRMMRFVKLPSAPLNIVWSSHGEWVIAGCEDGHLRVIESESLQVLSDQPVLPGAIYSLALAPSADHVIVAGVGPVTVVALPQ